MEQKKQKPKMLKLQMVEFIKTCDKYHCKFNFGHIFSSIVLPLSAGEIDFQKTLFGENG